MSSVRPTRILVADSDARIRSALQTLLRQEPEQLTIKETADLGGLSLQVKDFQPDLVLLNWGCRAGLRLRSYSLCTD